jgi:hypothetical protein
MQGNYEAPPEAAVEKAGSLLSRLESLADENQLLAELDALSDDDVERLLHRRYGPVYLNLFSLFRQKMPAGKLREIAVHLTKAAIRSASTAERWLARFPENPLKFCLEGWQPDALRTLLSRGRGLIVCSYRIGMYPLVPLDLGAMGFQVFLPLAEIKERTTKALDGLRDRVNASASLRAEERHNLLSMSSIRLLDVEAKHTAITLLKALRKGGVVMIYVDGNNGVDGPWGEEGRIPVSFLRSSIHVKTGVARLAWSLGAPILPVVSFRNSHGCGGTVHVADPIVPSDPNPADRDGFVRASMQRLYGILEDYASEYPEQWEGVSALHRWQHHGAPVAGHIAMPGEERANTVAAALQQGRRLYINERMGITAVPGEEGVWVDTNTMRCFRAPASAQHLFSALAREGGVDQSWIDHQTPREPLLSLLATLYARKLITAA